MFQRAVREPFFPDEWIVMHLVQNKLVCRRVWGGVGVHDGLVAVVCVLVVSSLSPLPL